MSYGERIMKNAAWLVLATTLNKLVAFATFYLIARLTGPTVTGTYFYGVSVTSVFVILSDLGMTPVLIRAFAGAREDAPRIFGAVFRAKAILAPLAIVCALVYGYVNHVDIVTMETIVIACLVMTADTFHLALYGALRGKQNLKIEAVGMLIGQLLTGLCAVAAAKLQMGAPGLAAALLVGSVWNVVWAYKSTRKLKISLIPPQRNDYQKLFHEAIPFGISGIAVKVYSYVDSLLLHKYYGATTVGMYAVAYKMTYALQFVPLTFSAALYPALAAAWAEKNTEAMKRAFINSMRILGLLGCLCAAALSALAPRMIPLLYGDRFADAIIPMQILPWVLLPIFMDFPIGSLLNATHRAHLKTSAMVATMIVNAVLNIVLVPSIGLAGAACAGVVSFWFLFFVGAWFTRRDVGFVSTLLLLGKNIVVGAVAWLAWRYASESLPFIVAVITGGVVGVVAGFCVQMLTLDDLRFVWRIRR